MGMAMLDEMLASAGGRVRLLSGAVSGFCIGGGAVKGVEIRGTGSNDEVTRVYCGAFVNACGPFANPVHERMCEALAAGSVGSRWIVNSAAVEASASEEAATPLPSAARPHALPLLSEVHAKVVFRDVLGAIPRDAPMTICADPPNVDPAALSLPWSREEAEFIADSMPAEAAARLLVRGAPGGAHFRPYGGDALLLLWEHWHAHLRGREPEPADSVSALLDHELYPEAALRALSRCVPGLACYTEEGAAPRHASVDGGYYTKTRENLPLVGPAPGPCGQGAAAGAYLCCAVSGYGVMAAHAAGELAAMHVSGGEQLAAGCGSSDGGMSGAAAAAGRGPASTAGVVVAGDAAQVRAAGYARLLSPMRYQDHADFMRPGGGRDRLLGAGGGQL